MTARKASLFAAFVVAADFVSGDRRDIRLQQTRELRRRDRASERERIAKDLHDVLGHSLSSLALKAELARRVFHADPNRALAEIGDVERIARQALEEMRTAIHGYYSGDIYAELDRAESLLKAADVNVERRCEQLEMPPAKERVLALIVREAVTNMLRHRRQEPAASRVSGRRRVSIGDHGRRPRRHARGRRGHAQHPHTRRSARRHGRWSSAIGTHLAVSLPISAAGHG